MHMVTPELLEFIRTERGMGMSGDNIIHLLITEGGWAQEDIDEAFGQITKGTTASQAKPNVLKESVAADAPVVTSPPPSPAITLDAPAVISDTTKDGSRTLELLSEKIDTSPVPKNIVTESLIRVSDEKEIIKHDAPPMPISSPAEKEFHINISPEEDFLGIFKSFVAGKDFLMQKEKEIAAESPVLERKIQLTGTVGSGEADIDLNAIVSNKEESMTKEAPISVSGKNILTSTPPKIVPDISEPETVFKFDFEKMRATPRGQSAGVVADLPEITTVAGLQKPIKQIDPLLEADGGGAVTHDPITLVGRRTMAGDLLLRGLVPAAPIVPPPSMSKSVSPIASPKVPSESLPLITPPPAPAAAPSVTISNAPVPHSVPPVDGDIARKNKTKRILGISIGGLLVLAALGGAFYSFTLFQSSGIRQLSTNAFLQFFNATSFSYEGKGFVNLSASSAVAGTMQTNTINLSLDYNGALLSNSLGYGDGAHHLKLSGDFQSGQTKWPINAETDIRILGSSLYFHVLAFPETSELDPELFNTYWMKIDLAEIAKELAISGVMVAQSEYGNFGTQGGEGFNALLKTYAPFEASKSLPDEVVAGFPASHISMTTNGDQALLLVQGLYLKFMGKEMVMTPDERVRLRDALAKVKLEIWVNQSTGALMQTRLVGNFDDEILGAHVKGTIDFIFAFTNFDTPVSVETPSTILTLDELKVQIEQNQKKRIIWARDSEKTDRLSGLRLSIDSYKSAMGRYPTELNDLYGAGIISSAAIPEEELDLYTYASYVGSSPLTKSNRCTPSTKKCDFYHIGVNLEDVSGPLLSKDDDITTEVHGADAKGCKDEKNVACYDIVSSSL